MANKAQLVTLPLEGIINLSHNKLDVHNPGNNGFLHNNGVVYGNVLSPVYRHFTSNAYDIYDAKERPYLVTKNALTRDGETLMSYTNKTFDTETLDLTYIDSVYKYNNDLHYIKVLNDSVIWYNGNTHTYPLTGSVVLATRIIDEQTIVVFYKNSSGQYKVDFFSQSLGTISNTVNPTFIGAPIITYARVGTYIDGCGTEYPQYLVSVITDSGVDCKGQSFNYVLDVDVKSVDFQSTSTETVTTQTETQILLSDALKYKLGSYDVDAYITGVYYNNSGNVLRIRGNSDVYATLMYKAVDNMTRAEVIAEDFTGVVTDIADTRSYADKTWAKQYVGNGNASSTTTYPTPKFCIATDDMTTMDTVNGFLIVTFHNVLVNNEVTDLTLKWLPSTSYYTTATTKSLNKILDGQDFKGADGTWYYEDGTPYEYNYITVTGEATTSPLPNFNCDAILDNGQFITLKSLPYNDENVLEQGAYCFTGVFNRIENNTVYYDVDTSKKVLLAQQENKAAAYPYYYDSQVKSLGYNYFRDSLITKGADGETITHILYDTSSDNVILNAGYNSENKTNGKGGVASCYNWRVLYNNNYISAISYSEEADKIGTLLTDWNNISKILFVSENDIYFINNYNKVVHIWVETVDNDDMPYSFIEDRFIIVNTTSYFNCYDTVNDVQLHYASDYNNRFQEGVIINDALIQNNTNTGYLQEGTQNIIDASAQNANYEMTNDPIVGLTVADEVLTNVLVKDYNKIKSETNSTGVDYYRGIDSVTAQYDLSYKNGVEYKNTLLEDAVYPTDTPVYNPNIFTTYIKTYNQRDMVLNKATSTAYPLMKYNGQVYLAYLLVAGLENAEVIFAIQTLHYMVSNGFIYEIYYNGSDIDTYQAIMPCKGLVYLGCLPTEALFWNPLDRCVYSFAGDAIMRKAYQWNDIESISGTWYNPATQELFISTNLGLLCVSNHYQYLLDDLTVVNNIVFYDDHFIIQGEVDVLVKYEADTTTNQPIGSGSTVVLPGMPVTPIYSGTLNYQTDYLGNNALKSNFDCLYLRVFKVNEQPGYVKVKSTTVTDMGVETDERTYTIDSESWDDLTDSIYLRYQPKYQKACAISFEIESTNPIICHELGYTELGEIPAISSINI